MIPCNIDILVDAVISGTVGKSNSTIKLLTSNRNVDARMPSAYTTYILVRQSTESLLQLFEIMFCATLFPCVVPFCQ